MINGIGIDVVAIDRMAKLQGHALEKIFHADELKRALEFSSGVSSQRSQYLAGRFAAKEAFGKALGTGLEGISLSDICTLNDEHGRPYLVLSGSAKEKLGSRQALISISHDPPVAVATVIIQDLS